MKRWTGILIFLVLAGVGIAYYRSTHPGGPVLQTAPAGQQISYYTCTMHPFLHLDHPGNCPICGMRLVPVYESLGGSPVPAAVGHASHAGVSSQAEGSARVTVTISPEKQQLIGVRFETARVTSLMHTIRTSGRIAFDPALYSAITEYRSALEAAQGIHNGSSEGHLEQAGERAQEIVSASRTRLRLLGFDDTEIDRLGRDTVPEDSSLLLRGENGELWLYAQLYENEISSVKRGQPIEASIPGDSTRVYHSRIASIDPVVDPMTRTVKVRAKVVDREGVLRPEMYVDVKIPVSLGARLVIPAEAVMHTGEQDIVFVDLGEGRLEPRDVRVGAEGDGRVEILHGISSGEHVVVSGNFLIDSESRLRAAAQGSGQSRSQNKDQKDKKNSMPGMPGM